MHPILDSKTFEGIKLTILITENTNYLQALIMKVEEHNEKLD